MGLGADLMWTPVLRGLYELHGKPVRILSTPKLTDWLAGVPYDISTSRSDSPILSGLSYCTFNKTGRKSALRGYIDRMFDVVLDLTRTVKLYEGYWYRKSRRSRFSSLYMGLSHHSYAECDLLDRYIWKAPGHIIDVLASSVGLASVTHKCEMCFTEKEMASASEIVGKYGLENGFVVIEPCTNTDYFGDLRAWPIPSWQRVVDALSADRPELKFVQIGLPGGEVLDRVVNLCGKLTFRESVAVMAKSKLFLGTEGGFMHAANAADVQAVIVWGGVTLPEFAGYGDEHRILCARVPCAPCGLKGRCDEGHLCMLSIHPKEVVAAVEECLA